LPGRDGRCAGCDARRSGCDRHEDSTGLPRPVADTFTLTATQANFAQYYPTYLANGYWSVASSLLGTAPTVSHMAGLMDYEADDVSRPAAIP